jgi:hypothetical protein
MKRQLTLRELISEFKRKPAPQQIVFLRLVRSALYFSLDSARESLAVAVGLAFTGVPKLAKSIGF